VSVIFFTDESRLPPHLSISGGWKRTRRDGTLGPTEQFSATSLNKFSGCQRAWAWSYIAGVKEKFSSPAAALGQEIHNQLDGYYEGKPLLLEHPDESKRFAAERALPATHYMPRPDQVQELYREASEWLDTSFFAPNFEPLQIQIKRDLEFKYDNRWFTFDYKSVNSWERMLTEESLREDLQGILYPIDTMIRRRTDSVDGMWLYILTDPKALPEARPLTAHFEYQDVAARAYQVIRQADHMRNLIRLRVHPNSLPPCPEKCLEYHSPARDHTHKKGPKPETGGCAYRREIGGPCDYDGPKPRFFGKKNDKTMTVPQFITNAEPPQPPLPPGAQLPPEGYKWHFNFQTNTWGAVPLPPPPAPVAPTFVMPPVPFAPPEASQFVAPPVVMQPPAFPTVTASAPVEVSTPTAPTFPVIPEAPGAGAAPEKTRRKRRTKAEMAADALAAACGAAPTSAPVTQPVAITLNSNAPDAAAAIGAAVKEELAAGFTSAPAEQVSIRIARANGFVFEVPVASEAYRKTIREMAMELAQEELGE
jgi:hypothetical protein